MSDEDKIVIPQIKPHRFQFRGALKSKTLNDMQEETLADISSISSAVNSLNSRLTKVVLALQNDLLYLKKEIEYLKNNQSYQEKVAGVNNYLISRYLDFGDTKGLSFPNDLEDDRSAMINSEFGEITLPVNLIENKFYSISLRNNKVISQPGLDVSVRGTFDKGLGDGLVNYERGGVIGEGDVTQAFNGSNDKFWIRRVEFPLDSRVDQVECEMTVIVPQGTSAKGNTIEVVPFPNGSVDIMELAVASDLGNNFTRVDGFEPIDNSIAKRYHFAATTIDQIRIRLRQRNWVEENGKKVFYYGLQELSLKLIDYDKTYVYGAPFGSNNSFIYRIDAPDGYIFTSLQRVDPSPNFLLEDQALRHVHLRIGSNSDLSSGLIWNSDTDLPPQDLSSVPNIGTSTLYAFFELNFVSSSGGILSPYIVGTTPYVKGLGLSFTLSKT